MNKAPFKWPKCGIGLAIIVIGLGACAGGAPAPTEQVTLSSSIIRDAESAGAVEHAPVELNLAREKLERARLLMQAGNNEEARRLAEQAEMDARLAEVKARTETTQRAVEAVDTGIETLRREMNGAPTS